MDLNIEYISHLFERICMRMRSQFLLSDIIYGLDFEYLCDIEVYSLNRYCKRNTKNMFQQL